MFYEEQVRETNEQFYQLIKSYVPLIPDLRPEETNSRMRLEPHTKKMNWRIVYEELVVLSANEDHRNLLMALINQDTNYRKCRKILPNFFSFYPGIIWILLFIVPSTIIFPLAISQGFHLEYILERNRSLALLDHVKSYEIAFRVRNILQISFSTLVYHTSMKGHLYLILSENPSLLSSCYSYAIRRRSKRSLQIILKHPQILDYLTEKDIINGIVNLSSYPSCIKVFCDNDLVPSTLKIETINNEKSLLVLLQNNISKFEKEEILIHAITKKYERVLIFLLNKIVDIPLLHSLPQELYLLLFYFTQYILILLSEPIFNPFLYDGRGLLILLERKYYDKVTFLLQEELLFDPLFLLLHTIKNNNNDFSFLLDQPTIQKAILQFTKEKQKKLLDMAEEKKNKAAIKILLNYPFLSKKVRRYFITLRTIDYVF